MIQKLDGEIKSTFENQDDLSTELDSSTDFHTAASITMDRSSAIYEKYKILTDCRRIIFFIYTQLIRTPHIANSDYRNYNSHT